MLKSISLALALFGLGALPAPAQEYKIAVIGLLHSHVWSHLPEMAKGKTAKLVGIAETVPELVAEARRVAGDGVPILPVRSMYVAWARVLGHDFAELVRETQHHHRTLIDQYGATNPAEFFAVVTETFFEKPTQLRAKYPALYGQMQQFYRQDPAVLALSR